MDLGHCSKRKLKGGDFFSKMNHHESVSMIKQAAKMSQQYKQGHDNRDGLVLSEVASLPCPGGMFPFTPASSPVGSVCHKGALKAPSVLNTLNLGCHQLSPKRKLGAAELEPLTLSPKSTMDFPAESMEVDAEAEETEVGGAAEARNNAGPQQHIPTKANQSHQSHQSHPTPPPPRASYFSFPSFAAGQTPPASTSAAGTDTNRIGFAAVSANVSAASSVKAALFTAVDIATSRLHFSLPQLALPVPDIMCVSLRRAATDSHCECPILPRRTQIGSKLLKPTGRIHSPHPHPQKHRVRYSLYSSDEDSSDNEEETKELSAGLRNRHANKPCSDDYDSTTTDSSGADSEHRQHVATLVINRVLPAMGHPVYDHFSPAATFDVVLTLTTLGGQYFASPESRVQQPVLRACRQGTGSGMSLEAVIHTDAADNLRYGIDRSAAFSLAECGTAPYFPAVTVLCGRRRVLGTLFGDFDSVCANVTANLRARAHLVSNLNGCMRAIGYGNCYLTAQVCIDGIRGIGAGTGGLTVDTSPRTVDEQAITLTLHVSDYCLSFVEKTLHCYHLLPTTLETVR
jgi:hypothetical protein